MTQHSDTYPSRGTTKPIPCWMDPKQVTYPITCALCSEPGRCLAWLRSRKSTGCSPASAATAAPEDYSSITLRALDDLVVDYYNRTTSHGTRKAYSVRSILRVRSRLSC